MTKTKLHAWSQLFKSLYSQIRKTEKKAVNLDKGLHFQKLDGILNGKYLFSSIKYFDPS